MAGRERTGEETEEERDSNAWMVTFSDLLTLMITFFVLLLSMSSMDEKKLEEMFGIFTEAMGPLELGRMRELRGIKESVNIETIYQEYLIEKNIISGILAEAIADKKGVPIDVLKGGTDFDEMVSVDDRGVVVTLSDVILFGPGETRISAESYPVLDKLAEHLKEIDYLISVEGHTDSTPAGSKTSNWAISAKRAMNVMRYLNEVSGIGMERLSSRGYGEYSPLVDNSTPEKRARNRRIEIVLSKRW